MEIGIPLDSESGFGGAAGRRPLDMVATGNLLENAKVGDIFSARMCLNRGAAPFGSATVLLSGHR
jgi:hypothetical protein